MALGAPDVALLAADDGMLHAFRADDGEELWAWIPGWLLFADREGWAARLVDPQVAGRAALFDGTPVVEDVWIDADGDGRRSCALTGPDCEWRRVVVVPQGRAGPAVLALDITDPTAPYFLWEHHNAAEPGADALAVSQPVIARLPDAAAPGGARWAALWGSGRAVPASAWSAPHDAAEPNLVQRWIADDYWSSPAATYAGQVLTGALDAAGSNYRLDHSADRDGDGRGEGGFIAGSPTAVDLDFDGVVDVAYLLVTAAGDAPQETRLVKALFDGGAPGAPRWCEVFTPAEAVGAPVEAHFAPTASWLAGGGLGLYWGSGGPFDGADQDRGYLFALRDAEPWACAPLAPICGGAGAMALEEGERLTEKPIVFDGVVLFSSWIAQPGGCDGEGRLYGVDYQTCSAALTGDDGQVSAYVTTDGYPSSLVVSDHGTIFYGVAGAGEDAPTLGALSDLAAGFQPTTTLHLAER